MVETPYFTAMMAGGAAGLAVDVTLYPLDTIKTRLQSEQGFIKAGGLRGVYKGLFSAAIGSAPGAALFFSTYETVKSKATPLFGPEYVSAVHMGAAISGEVIACLVRVPTENLKQRMQVGGASSYRNLLQDIVKTRGLGGFWGGYWSTVIREVPFSLIQFPLYERMKRMVADSKGVAAPSPWEAAACGSAAGAIGAAVTTPLDVAKTRIMLDAKSAKSKSVSATIKAILKAEGAGALWSGVVPRVCWIGVGGFVFFGAYEGARDFIMDGERSDS